MSLELLDARETAAGFAVTFATNRGLEQLEGTSEELARLARAMRQVAVLAQLDEHETVWLDAIRVGEATVKLGVAPGGEARVLIARA